MSWRGKHIRFGGNVEGNNKKEDKPMVLADDADNVGLKERPLTRKQRKAKKRKLKAHVPERDGFLDRVVKENITGTATLSDGDKDRLTRIQRATGITEQLRKKLDSAQGLRVEFAADKTPRANNLVQVPLDYYAARSWIDERQYLAGTEFHKLWYYGAVKLGYAQMKLGKPQGSEPNPDFLNIATDKYTKAKLIINGLLPALVCYNVCCLGEWASYLGPEELEGKKVKRHRLMDHLRGGLDDLADHFKYRNKAS